MRRLLYLINKIGFLFLMISQLFECEVHDFNLITWDDNQFFTDEKPAMIFLDEKVNKSSLIQSTLFFLNGEEVHPELIENEDGGKKGLQIKVHRELSPGDRLDILVQGKVIIEPDKILLLFEEKTFFYQSENPPKLVWEIKNRGEATISPTSPLTLLFLGEEVILQQIREDISLLEIEIKPDIEVAITNLNETNEIIITPENQWSNCLLYSIEVKSETLSNVKTVPDKPLYFYPQTSRNSEVLDINWLQVDNKLSLEFEFSDKVELNSVISHTQFYPYLNCDWEVGENNTIILTPKQINRDDFPLEIELLSGITNPISKLESQHSYYQTILLPPDIPKIEEVTVISAENETSLLLPPPDCQPIGILVNQTEMTNYTRSIKIRVNREFNIENSSKILQAIQINHIFPDIGPNKPVRKGFFFTPDKKTLYLNYEFSDIIEEYHPHFYRINISIPPDTYQHNISNYSIPKFSQFFKEQIYE